MQIQSLGISIFNLFSVQGEASLPPPWQPRVHLQMHRRSQEKLSLYIHLCNSTQNAFQGPSSGKVINFKFWTFDCQLIVHLNLKLTIWDKQGFVFTLHFDGLHKKLYINLTWPFQTWAAMPWAGQERAKKVKLFLLKKFHISDTFNWGHFCYFHVSGCVGVLISYSWLWSATGGCN